MKLPAFLTRKAASKKVLTPSTHPMAVLLIDDSSEEIHTMLGITPERAAHLAKMAVRLNNECNGRPVVYAATQFECVPPNELFFMSMMLAQQVFAGHIIQVVSRR